MADAAEEDVPVTKRESHYNNQRSSYRSSLRSDTSTGPLPPRHPQSDLQRLSFFDLDIKDDNAQAELADSDYPPSLISTASPAPYVPYTRSPVNRNVKKSRRSLRNQTSRSSKASQSRDGPSVDDTLAHESWLHLDKMHALSSPGLPLPRQREETSSPPPIRRSRPPSLPLGRAMSRDALDSQLNITALPSIMGDSKVESGPDQYMHSKRTPQARAASKVATELYTLSYLIFFSIWGTLARVGLQALTFYPGAPISFSELWANVAGTFILGFLAEDRQLFRAEWGSGGDRVPEPSDQPTEPKIVEHKNAKARHSKVKKTIPMYIGLATGFCGSFTSFSSFMRDIFLALSNDMRSPINHPYTSNTPIPDMSTTVSRHGGDSFMAICATVIITIATCYAALKVGAHLALLLDPYTPTLPFRHIRRIIDPMFVFLGWGTWLGAVLMAIFPPHNAWRGQALFACVFAPLGCIIRYYASVHLNSISPYFPVGTFTVNIFGTAVLGMAYDLQHVPLQDTGLTGGSIAGCQVLQGIMDGFCGALTTVSTWISEIDSLKRRHAYVYGSASVVSGLCLLVIIMGTVRWSVGWEATICTT